MTVIQKSNAFMQHSVLVLNANGLPIGFPVKRISAEEAVLNLLNDTVVMVKDSSIIARAENIELVVPSIVMYRRFAVCSEHNQPAPLNCRNLFIRDRRRCVYSNRELSFGHRDETLRVSIDHVQPKSREGPDSWENWVLAAARLNTKKSDKIWRNVEKRMRIRPWVPTLADLTYLWLEDPLCGVNDDWREVLQARPSDQVCAMLAQDRRWAA